MNLNRCQTAEQLLEYIFLGSDFVVRVSEGARELILRNKNPLPVPLVLMQVLQLGRVIVRLQRLGVHGNNVS